MVVAAELSIGILKVVSCNTIPMYITGLFVIPTQKMTLGFNESKNFQVMGNFESHPEAGSLAVLIKQTVTALFVQLHVPERVWETALDPLVDAILERFANASVSLAKTECANPMPSYLATAEADIREGGGVTIKDQTITSGKQEASGYIRPKLGFLAPWPYAAATSTPFQVDKRHCTGAGDHKLEYFDFLTSGGPSALDYTWYITNTACDGSTLSHESSPGKEDFFYPGSLLGPGPAYRCDGIWHNFTLSDSRPGCEWVPENPYLCTFTQTSRSTFKDGVLTNESGEEGVGYWRDGQEIRLNSHGTVRYDLATGVFTINFTADNLHFSVADECLDRISDLRESYTYTLPVQDPVCVMVDECPK